MCTHYTQVSEKDQFAYSLKTIIPVGLNNMTSFMVLKLACEGVHVPASVSPHQQSLISCMCEVEMPLKAAYGPPVFINLTQNSVM